MIIFKIAPVFLFALVVGAEKKIELQDIEEDNLKSERQKDDDHIENRPQTGSGSGPESASLDFLKNGFLRYFQQSHPLPTPTRFIHQYSVTEQPEPAPSVVSSHQQPQYVHSSGPASQQAMVGYLSNVPMQIYLVPQYYSEAPETGASAHAGGHYIGAAASRVTGYTAPEAVQTQSNYIEVPSYVPPTAKTYVQQYTQPVAYVGYTAQPTVSPTAPSTTQSVVTYQVPVVQYQSAVVAQQHSPKGYQYEVPQYTETNSVDELQETALVDESTKHHSSHAEVSYSKVPANEFPRYYSARPSQREEYRHNRITELPHPNPLLLKGSPSHLAHIPKALPMYRPLNKPVYRPTNHIPGIPIRGSEHYEVPFKRRPTSLLDSYVPSRLQIEYMKRGYTNDPLQAYEDLSSGRHFAHAPRAPVTPRHYERGFLPNQMYNTAAGGVTFGHYKRTPKIEKSTH